MWTTTSSANLYVGLAHTNSVSWISSMRRYCVFTQPVKSIVSLKQSNLKQLQIEKRKKEYVKDYLELLVTFLLEITYMLIHLIRHLLKTCLNSMFTSTI